MMEDTGEDILRQKPSVVGSFFKRLGQVKINDERKTRFRNSQFGSF